MPAEGRGLSLDLPRFRGEMRAWDQALWLDVMLSSGLVAFFGSAPGGAILPFSNRRPECKRFPDLSFSIPFFCSTAPQAFFRPDRRLARPPRAARSMTAPLWGRPEGLSLTAASTVAGLGGRGPRKCAWLDGSSPLGGSMSLPGPPFSTRSSCTGRTMASGFRRRYVPNALSQAGAGRIARSSRPVPAGTASAASAANEFQLKDHVMGPALQWATGT